MKLEIIGTPIMTIFEILKSTDKIHTLKYYNGKINIFISDSNYELKEIKKLIISKLSGVVNNYIMKVVN